VKCCVDDQEETLLNAIPDVVDIMVTLGDLQLRRNPNAKDTDVDEAKDNGSYPSNLDGVSSVDHKKRNSVDDDSANALNLDNPGAH
jgi:hypothetical protein